MEDSIPLLIGLAALLFLTIIMLLVWRVIRLRQGDTAQGSQYLNLSELRKQGLLSDNEMKQVGSALARQIERREQEEKKRQAARRASELELDPEIRRIEIQAEVARVARLQALQQQPIEGAGPVTPAAPSAANLQAPAVSDHEPDDELWETLEDEPQETEAPVDMPPDVVAMYESGIITEEEFEEAKKKYREQRRK